MSHILLYSSGKGCDDCKHDTKKLKKYIFTSLIANIIPDMWTSQKYIISSIGIPLLYIRNLPSIV